MGGIKLIILMHNITKDEQLAKYNSNYNSLFQVEAAKNHHITLDGVYLNVWENRSIFNYRGEKTLFVMGDYVGKDNTFDKGMPYEKYCDWDQIFDLRDNFGFEVGWHTWSHRNLVLLSDEEVIKEITPPFPMKKLAFPYGNVDQRVASLAEKAGYEAAYSVNQGDGSRYQMNRYYWEH